MAQKFIETPLEDDDFPSDAPISPVAGEYYDYDLGAFDLCEEQAAYIIASRNYATTLAWIFSLS